MGLPRTFVGFSSTDINYYYLMCAWKKNEHIDFDFTDCQLKDEVDSDNEVYIKRKCRERISLAGTFALLIGDDTRYKHKYVAWEAEVAIEQGCRLIGINLNGSRRVDETRTPSVFKNAGALFVAYKPGIIKVALESTTRHDSGNWYYEDSVYDKYGVA